MSGERRPAAHDAAAARSAGTVGRAVDREARRTAGSDSGMKSAESEEEDAAESERQEASARRGHEGRAAKARRTMRAQDNEGRSATTSSGRKNMSAENTKAEGRDSKTARRPPRPRPQQQHEGAETKSTAESKSTTTTGQAGAGAKLTTEQRTKITTVISSQHVEPVTNVNFSISVGTRVPRDVHFHPLPAESSTIYPEWRGYEFILVNDQIIIIDPQTYEIVDDHRILIRLIRQRFEGRAAMPALLCRVASGDAGHHGHCRRRPSFNLG